jgi:hypothetical protein
MKEINTYKKVASLRRKAGQVKVVWKKVGMCEMLCYESQMPDWITEKRLAEIGISEPEEQKLAALYWFLPGEKKALDNAPGFLAFLKSREIDELENVRAAAIAFGCGWRPFPGNGEEPWGDAVRELGFCANSLVRGAIRQLQSLGISFPFEDLGSQVYCWSDLCCEALLGRSPFESSYGKHQGSFGNFQAKDCSSIKFFMERLRKSLYGFMSGRKITAEGFTGGILWHVLRQTDVESRPPQDRCHEGWIRFTEQAAICVSKDLARNGRSIAIVNEDCELTTSVSSLDIRPGESISVGKRIYRAQDFDTVAFYRITGAKSYEREKSKLTGKKQSNLLVRVIRKAACLDLDKEVAREWVIKTSRESYLHWAHRRLENRRSACERFMFLRSELPRLDDDSLHSFSYHWARAVPRDHSVRAFRRIVDLEWVMPGSREAHTAVMMALIRAAAAARGAGKVRRLEDKLNPKELV